jgi:hypothetical protein
MFLGRSPFKSLTVSFIEGERDILLSDKLTLSESSVLLIGLLNCGLVFTKSSTNSSSLI